MVTRLGTMLVALGFSLLFGVIASNFTWLPLIWLMSLAGGAVGFGIPLVVVRVKALKSFPIEGVLYSWVFYVTYIVAGLIVMTSSGSVFSKTVLYGVGIALLSDMLASMKDPQVLASRWFGLFRANLSTSEQRLFVYGGLVAFGVLLLLGIRS